MTTAFLDARIAELRSILARDPGDPAARLDLAACRDARAALRPKPVRLQLKRTEGFRLQAASKAANGLPAVKCARPGLWGNPWRVGLADCSCRSAGECAHNTFRAATAAAAVEAYRIWSDGWTHPHGRASLLPELRDKNLACWCKLCERHAALGGKRLDEPCPDCAPCHVDVLGRRVLLCEEV